MSHKVTSGIRFEPAVPIEQLAISGLNPRSHRDEVRIAEIAELMQAYGFDPAYALKTYWDGAVFQVFAGGNRLLAAQHAGLTTVPVYVYEGLDRSDLWRLAYQDNEQAGKHSQMNPVDIWCDYARRSEQEGWTQEEMARSLGVSQQLVSLRIRLSRGAAFRQPVLDGSLDEGHCQEILAVYQTSSKLDPWLTTDQAQAELVDEVLGSHRGSSAGIKPTVKKVREAARRWKRILQSAVDAFQSLPDEICQGQFVKTLINERVRTEAGVNQTLNQIVNRRRLQEESTATKLRAEADQKEREAQRLLREQHRLAYLEGQTAKLRHGDARAWIAQAPASFHLLLTDPPYGMEFQSNRPVVTDKKPKIANDGKDEALALLADVLTKAYSHMADEATCLIFTGWRWEPEFRRILESAGFTIKGSLIWVKNNHGSGDLAGSFAPKHERIIHAVKGTPKLQRRAADVLSAHAAPTSDHPTEKPRDLLRQLIEATTAPGDVVVDPFAGSGNTLIEAYAFRLQ